MIGCSCCLRNTRQQFSQGRADILMDRHLLWRYARAKRLRPPRNLRCKRVRTILVLENVREDFPRVLLTGASMHHFKVQVRIEIEKDGDAFYAFCPDLKGLHVDGATEQEARQNAIEAVGAYMRSLVRHDEPIPVGIIRNSASGNDNNPDHAGATVEEILVEA